MNKKMLGPLRPQVEPLRSRRAGRGAARQPPHRGLLLARRAARRRGRLRPRHRRARRRQVRHLAHSRRAARPGQRDVKVGIVSRPQAGPLRLLSRDGRPVRRRAFAAQPLGRRQGPARPLAGAHRRRAVAPGAHRRRGAGDEARRPRRAAPAVAPRASTAKSCSPWCSPATAACCERLRSDELLPLDSRMRVRLALERATPDELAELLAARAARGRRRQADDARADRHPRRSRPGQPACAHEHRRRAARRRRPARGPAHRREAVPRDLRPAASPKARPAARTASDERAARRARLAPRRARRGAALARRRAVVRAGRRHRRRRAQVLQVVPRSRPRRRGRLRRRPACAASPCPRPDASCSTPPRTHCTSCAAASTASLSPPASTLADLDIQVITAPGAAPRPRGRSAQSLAETVDRLRPRLLILDPFVRLHRIDENASGEVAPAARLSARAAASVTASPCSSCTTPGRAPPASAPARPCAAPPSSTPGATATSICVATARSSPSTVEHRAAPVPALIAIELAQRGPALALEVVERAKPVAAPKLPRSSARHRRSPKHKSRFRSPTCAPDAGSGPPLSTSASACSPPLAASSRPSTATVSQTADPGTRLNQVHSARHPPTSRFRFPISLQPPGTGNGKSAPTTTPRSIQRLQPSITATTRPSKSAIRLTVGPAAQGAPGEGGQTTFSGVRYRSRLTWHLTEPGPKPAPGRRVYLVCLGMVGVVPEPRNRRFPIL